MAKAKQSPNIAKAGISATAKSKPTTKLPKGYSDEDGSVTDSFLARQSPYVQAAMSALKNGATEQEAIEAGRTAKYGAGVFEQRASTNIRNASIRKGLENGSLIQGDDGYYSADYAVNRLNLSPEEQYLMRVKETQAQNAWEGVDGYSKSAKGVIDAIGEGGVSGLSQFASGTVNKAAFSLANMAANNESSFTKYWENRGETVGSEYFSRLKDDARKWYEEFSAAVDEEGNFSAGKAAGATARLLVSLVMNTANSVGDLASQPYLLSRGVNEMTEKITGSDDVAYNQQQILNKAAQITEPLDVIREYVDVRNQRTDSDVLQKVGNTSEVVGNILPSVALSRVSKVQELGTLAMANAAGGNASREAYSNGATLKEATDYGRAVRNIEWGTEHLFGGIEAFGDGALSLTKSFKNKLTDFAYSNLGKILLKTYDILGENVEEGASDYLTPIAKRAYLGTEEEDVSFMQAMLGQAPWTSEGIVTLLSTFALNALSGTTNIKKVTNKEASELLDIAHKTGDQKLIAYADRLQKKVTGEEGKSKVSVSEASELNEYINAKLKNSPNAAEAYAKAIVEEAAAKKQEAEKQKATEKFFKGTSAEGTDFNKKVDTFAKTNFEGKDRDITMTRVDGQNMVKLTADDNSSVAMTLDEAEENHAIPEDVHDFMVQLDAKLGEFAEPAYAAYDGSMSTGDYIRALDYGAIVLAANNISLDTAGKDTDVGKLTPIQKKLAVSIGQNMAKNRVTVIGQRGNGTVSFGKTENLQDGMNAISEETARSVWGEEADDNINFLQTIAEATGNDIVVYDSKIREYQDEQGNNKIELGPKQGMYSTAGTIYIDARAGQTKEGLGKAVLSYTMSHELTHFLEHNAGKSYDELKSFVLDNLSGLREGKTLQELVEEKMAASSKPMRYDDAVFEVVADSCETMLQNSKYIQQVAKEKPTLAQKIKDWIDGFLEKLRATLKGKHEGAKYFESSEKLLQELSALWDQALQDAIANTSAQSSEKNSAAEQAVDAKVEAGEAVPPNEEMEYSTRYDEEYMDKALYYAQGNGFMYVSQSALEEAKKARELIRAKLTDPKLIDKLNLPEDIEGNTFIPDSSYGGTEENTTVCIRSLAAQALMDEVAKDLGRPLTVEDTLLISEEIMSLTDKPECIYCYVATDRRAYREFLGNYIGQRDAVIANLNNGMDRDTAYKAFLDGRKPTDNMRTRFDMWVNFYQQGRAQISPADLASMETLLKEDSKLRFDILKYVGDQNGISPLALSVVNDKRNIFKITGTVKGETVTFATGKSLLKDAAIADSVGRFMQIVDAENYAQGASWAKKMNAYTAYDNHILSWKDDRIKKLNSHYGLRMYSFSDFSPAFILENMQMVTDASVRGLKILAYTKELDFARIFAPTGMNINISIFAAETNGQVTPDAMMGADWEEARKLREKYPNVGITLVATNDNILRYGIEQDFIDVVIPYHLVRTGQKVADYFGYKNYTDISSDGKIKGVKFGKNDQKSVYPSEHQNDLIRYVNRLQELNLTPRFSEYLNGYEDFINGSIDEQQFRAMNPYYMKLVNETRRSAAETPIVQPRFDTDAAVSSIDQMAAEGGYFVPIGGRIENQNDVAEELADRIRANEAAEQFSLRGVRDDGIEVYETSDETLSLSWKERKQRFINYLENEYRGRTAKFIRNGHPYYASFDKVDIKKNVYGDNESDAKGRDAKINTGADGDIFTLSENMSYYKSSPETGKRTEAHRSVSGWDYFVKTVQIDGSVFDVTANIRKKQDGEYVYYLKLAENETIKAASPRLLPNELGELNGVPTAYDLSISQTSDESNNNSQKSGTVSQNSERDTAGNVLSNGQKEYFKDSKIRDENGNLMLMYHGTVGNHTYFDPQYANDGRTFFLTDKLPVAQSYAKSFRSRSLLDDGTTDSVSETKQRASDAFDDAMMKIFGTTNPQEIEKLYPDFPVKKFIGALEEFKNYQETPEGKYSNAYLLDYASDILFSEAADLGLIEIYSPEERTIRKQFRDLSTALEYRNSDRNSLPMYVNASNPLIIDAKGVAWNRIPITTAMAKEASHEDAWVYEDGHFKGNTRLIAEYAQNHGYDGIMIKNVMDMGSSFGERQTSTVVAVFDSNQAKDVKNLMPTTDQDFRYSERDTSTGVAEEDAETARKYFGSTNRLSAAGYLTVNGNMLDFSGIHDGADDPNIRTVDHRDISDAFGYEYGSEWGYSGAMLKFMDAGNIRVIPETNGIELMKKPNREQADKLYDLFDYFRRQNPADGITVDLDTFNGVDTSDPYNIRPDLKTTSVNYTAKTSAGRIIKDINAFFDNGTIPEGTGNGMEQFSWSERDNAKSDRELLVDALDTVAQNDEEIAQLENYRKNVDRLNELDKKLSSEQKILRKLVAGGGTDAEIAAQRQKVRDMQKKLTAQDEKLLDLQAATPLKNVLAREKKRVGDETRRMTRERLQERENVTKYRAQVEKKAKKLYRLLSEETIQRHVPNVLQQPLAEFLDSINFDSRRRLSGGEATKKDLKMDQITAELSRILSNQQKYISGDDNVEGFGGYIDISEESLQTLEEMGQKVRDLTRANGTEYTVNQMTAAELKDLSKLLSNIYTGINNINNFMANERYTSVKAAADEDMAHMGRLGAASENADNRFNKMYIWRNFVPHFAMKRYGAGAEAIQSGYERGWDKFAFNIKEIEDFSESTFTSKEVNSWERDIREIELEDGSKIKISIAQIMALAEHLKQQQSVQHIEKGGIRIGEIRRGRGDKAINDVKHYHLTGKDIENLLGQLSDRQIEVANKVQSFMAQYGSEKGNEISRRRFGYDAFTEGENYYPIKTDDNTRPMQPTDDQSSSLFRLLNLGSTKKRNPKANNALVINSIFDTFADHTGDMAKYNALALPVLDAIKYFNYNVKDVAEDGSFSVRSMQGAMEQAFGKEAKNYYRTLLKDINGAHEGGDRTTDVFNLARNYKISAVGANLRVVSLQPTAYVRASLIIKPKHLIAAFTHKNGYNEAMKYSGAAVWKSLGFYDTNIARGLRDQIKNNKTLKDRAVEASMKGAEIADQRTWGRLWTACKLQAKEETGLTGEELNIKTADLFREVIYSSQVMDSTLTRSELMRSSNGIDQMRTAFMAEPTLSYNILFDAFETYRQDARENGKENALRRNADPLKKAFMVYVSSAVSAAIVESFWDAMRNSDDDDFWEKYMNAMFGEGDNFIVKFYDSNLGSDLSLLSKLPLFKVIPSILQGYGASSDMSAEGIQSLYNALVQMVNGNNKMTSWGTIYKLMQGVSQVTGLPISGLTRDVQAVWNNSVAVVFPNLKIRNYKILTGSKEEKWEEYAKPVGISQADYKRILNEADAIGDGNGSIKQDELGAYLESSTLTDEEKYAMWATQGWKATYDEWLADN